MFSTKVILLSLAVTATCVWICDQDKNAPCYPKEKTCNCFQRYSRCCLYRNECLPMVILNAVAGVSYFDGQIVYFKLEKNETGSIIPKVEKSNLPDYDSPGVNFTVQVGLTERPKSFEKLTLDKYDDWNRYKETNGILDKLQDSICDLGYSAYRSMKRELFDMDFKPRNISVPFTSNAGLGPWRQELVFQITAYDSDCSFRIDTDIFYHVSMNDYLMSMTGGVSFFVADKHSGITVNDIKGGRLPYVLLESNV